jgi:DNA-directed RNA polymerase, beta subunit/140 kD subunit
LAVNQAQSRHSFSRTSSAVPMPDLLGVQVDSFSNFLQLDATEDSREDHGLHEVFSKYLSYRGYS